MVADLIVYIYIRNVSQATIHLFRLRGLGEEMVHKILFITLIASALLPAQKPAQPDTWQPLRYFVGVWEGTGKGESGESKVEREYKFMLNNKFLQAAHKSVYAPQPKNPKGEVHEDLGFFSYDRSRKQFWFRQFHVEGFVIQYVLSSVSDDGRTLVFDSESIENIGAGWRSRETWKIINDNEFVETFDLAGPGKEFQTYSENRFRRKK